MDMDNSVVSLCRAKIHNSSLCTSSKMFDEFEKIFKIVKQDKFDRYRLKHNCHWNYSDIFNFQK